MYLGRRANTCAHVGYVCIFAQLCSKRGDIRQSDAALPLLVRRQVGLRGKLRAMLQWPPLDVRVYSRIELQDARFLFVRVPHLVLLQRNLG